jgi:hypothetical protein
MKELLEGGSYKLKSKSRLKKMLKLNGFTKIHMPGKKMRIIISNKKARTKRLAKWLADEFSSSQVHLLKFIKSKISSQCRI